MNQIASKTLLSLLQVSFLFGLHLSTEDGVSKFLRNVCRLPENKYSGEELNSNEGVMGRVLTLGITEVCGRSVTPGILNNTTSRKLGIFPSSGDRVGTHLISI
jgi:hypothetical protein